MSFKQIKHGSTALFMVNIFVYLQKYSYLCNGFPTDVSANSVHPLFTDNSTTEKSMTSSSKILSTLLLWVMIACHIPADGKALPEEVRAFEIMQDLVHNHTFDLENVRVADSLYREAETVGSTREKIYALRIKIYALVNNGHDKEFEEAVDEYVNLSLEAGEYSQYYDGMSAKIQYFLGKGAYTKCMFMTKEMLETAKENNLGEGLYESYLLLGQVYKYRQCYQTGIGYLHQAIQHIPNDDPTTDSIGHCLIYKEISESYSAINQNDSAIYYAEQACRWANVDVYRYVSEYTLLSAIFNTQDMDRFSSSYMKTLLYQMNFDEIAAMITTDMAVQLQAMVYTADCEYDKALDMANRKQEMQSRLFLLQGIYAAKDDYKAAYYTLLKQQALNDSIIAQMQQEELTEYDARLDNALLRAKAEEERVQRNIIIMVSTSLVLLLLLVAMILWNYRSRRHNIRLKLEKERTQRALEEAEKANAMRATFIQNMTHEFRTPLNAIVGFAQVLDLYDLEPDIKEITQNISGEGLALAHLLDDVIRISEYDTMSKRPRYIDLRPNEVVRNAMSYIKKPDESIVTLKIEDKTPEGYTFRANREMVEHAMVDLIGNAVKFTDKGTITIEITRTQDACVRFTITDTGKGIPAGQEEHIFERFAKLDEFIPGTGLGLPLCRVVATILGGRVYVDTNYKQQGARFVFEIPENFA